MKYAILIVPSLLPLCLAAAMSRQANDFPIPNTAAERNAQIRELRAECARNAARISALEAQGHNFVPR